MEGLNIYMCGVGGQGIGVLSEVMIQATLAAGHQVKSVDTHGLAQRGGVVVSHLRLGSKALTPRIAPGEADIVLALERLEAYRAIVNQLRDGGTVVYYEAMQQPIHVRMGKASYPSSEDVATAVAARQGRIEAVQLAELNDPRMQNTAVLGRLASLNLIPDVTSEVIEAALRAVLKPEAIEANLAVFQQAQVGAAAAI